MIIVAMFVKRYWVGTTRLLVVIMLLARILLSNQAYLEISCQDS